MNDCQSQNFMMENLFDGHRIRLFTGVDHLTREGLTIAVGQRLTGRQVVRELTRIGSFHETLRMDNGPVFLAKVPESMGLCRYSDAGLQPTGKSDG